jgi:hypothetical protein
MFTGIENVVDIDSERDGSGGAGRAGKVGTSKVFIGVPIWEPGAGFGKVFLFDGETDFRFLHSVGSRWFHNPIGENDDSSELILKLLDVLDDNKGDS